MHSKKIKYIITIALITFSAIASAFQVPTLNARVNDNARMFNAQTVTQLEQSLADFEQKTSVQIAILTVKSLDGAVLEEAAIKTANAWALGQKNQHNGLLIFISKDDRAARIEVGSGLESKITDIRAGRVIDEILVPNFKIGHFSKGITAAVNKLIEHIESDTLPAELSFEDQHDVPKTAIIINAIIVVALYAAAIAYMLYIFERTRKPLIAILDKFEKTKDTPIAEQPEVKAELTKARKVTRKLIWAHTLLVPLLLVQVIVSVPLFILFALTAGNLIANLLFDLSNGTKLNSLFGNKIGYVGRTTYYRGGGGGFSGGGFSGGGGGFSGGGSSGRW